jgi:hypothetical protein
MLLPVVALAKPRDSGLSVSQLYLSLFSVLSEIFRAYSALTGMVCREMGRFGPDFPNTRCSGWAKSLFLRRGAVDKPVAATGKGLAGPEIDAVLP